MNKTDQQRRLFHALCRQIGLDLGLTPGQVKHAIKEDYFGLDTFIVNGKRYTTVQSSEDADRVDYSALIDATFRWAAENGVYIEDRHD